MHFLADRMVSQEPADYNFTKTDFLHVEAAGRVAPEIVQKNLVQMNALVKKVGQSFV